MKNYLKILSICLLPLFAEAQVGGFRSIGEIFGPVNDSTIYLEYRRAYDNYEETNRDSALLYAQKCLVLARNNKKKLAEMHMLCNVAYQLIGMGRYADALQHLLETFKIGENKEIEKEKTWLLFSNIFSINFTGNNRLLMLAYAHHMMGILMRQTDNNDQSLIQFRQARNISSQIQHRTRLMMADMNLGRSFTAVNQLDSALLFENEAVFLAHDVNFKKYLGQIYQSLGEIYRKKNEPAKEIEYYYKAIAASIEQNNLNSLNSNYFVLTEYFLGKNEKDSALFYAMKNLETIQQIGPVASLAINLGTVYENIYRCYKLGNNPDSLFRYQGLTLVVKDSLYKIRIKNITAFQNATYNEQLRLQQVEKDKTAYQNKIRIFLLLAGIGVLMLLAWIFYRNNKQKQKANQVLEKTLSNLKSTQQQLVHAEKMASLGELTAGIAHEIQNPLNFVNNFAEINNELLDELKSQNEKLKIEEKEEILSDVYKNNEKIAYHGGRADSIVKGMLQHSRASSGKKELTDINALVDEYHRLAYHGLRAKDKSFNATIKTNFDPSIGKINIIPQDIGRVIMNLLTNAFYAVNEKARGITQNTSPEALPFEPTVTISTSASVNQRDVGRDISITVTDNGNGIPDSIKEKIFQPFFTTKPTGQGTGLGLSLSYDIIKAHGGSFKLISKENESCSFIITLYEKI